jgi:tocopherol O-methyltransferase
MQAAVRRYYEETTQRCYLERWGTTSLALHLGLDHRRDDDLNVSLDRTTRYVAERAKLRPGDRVLDAGCGVGGSALLFAREYGAHVVGVTLEPEQAKLGRRFAASSSLSDKVEIREGDFMALDLPPGSFDVVVNIESLCYAHDPRAYLAEVQRLLRPGGRFACVDVFSGRAGDADARRAMIEGCVLAEVREQGDAASDLFHAGFVDIEQEDLTSRVRGSAEVLRARSGHQLAVMSVERALLGKEESRTYEAHLRGGMGAALGILTGSVTYGFVGGSRPGTNLC